VFGDSKSSLPQKVIKPTLRQSKEKELNDDLIEDSNPYNEYDSVGMSARGNKLAAVKKMRRKSMSNRSKSKLTLFNLSS
jgi:hypothetical protein